MDLIFSMGSSSTVFVHDNYRNGPIPVVTVCSKDPVLLEQMPDYESGSRTNIAYTSLNAPIELQLDYLLKINQNLKYIIIMYAVDNISAVETQVSPLIEQAKKKDIVCIDLAVADQNKAKEELEQLMPVIVNRQKDLDPEFSQSIFWITGCTSVFNEIETINRYADKIPVLSVVSDVVKEGDNSAALSVGVGFENNAYLAGLYGVGILKGEYKAGELKVGVVSPPDIAINFKKVRQINMKIPFAIFESAAIVYDYAGKLVRDASKKKY
jgi:putative ABC transport system substrate-binding protein